MGEIVLIRHGETAWSAEGRHTSRTDVPLTDHGEAEARALRAALAGRDWAAVRCSPRQRARRTADLAGLRVSAVDDDLVEWDYGRYEGVGTAQIRFQEPDWDLWRDGCPDGETAWQVGTRADRVLGHARTVLERGDVALIGHGHCLRVVAARWVGLPASSGALLRLDTGTLSVLGFEHDRPVVRSWNTPVPADRR